MKRYASALAKPASDNGRLDAASGATIRATKKITTLQRNRTRVSMM